jgi:glutamate 5-kinase
MATKIQAAKIVVRSGIPLVIASGRKFDALSRILSGEAEGTLFVPAPRRLPSRKRWIAFFDQPRGSVAVDDGAVRALRENGRSLLAPGILRAEGNFSEGEVIRVTDAKGLEFARGLTRVAAAELATPPAPRVEVIHRDDLVIL